MCQPRPGMRCTHHTLARLKKLRSKLDKLIKRYDAVKNGRNKALKDELLAKIDVLQHKVAEAERDYYSSPGGIEELGARSQDPNLSAEERELASASLALAQYDRATLALAHRVHKRKHEMPRIDEYEAQRLALVQQEQQAAAVLARAINEKNKPLAVRAQQAAKKARSDRQKFEEALRLGGAHVSKLERASLHDLPLPDAKPDGTAQEISPDQLGRGKVFVGMSPSDFGRAAEYFPYGAYGEVTQVRVNAEGNYELEVEKSRWIMVGRNITVFTERSPAEAGVLASA